MGLGYRRLESFPRTSFFSDQSVFHLCVRNDSSGSHPFARNFRPFLVYFGIWIALVFGFPYLIAALFGIVAGQGIATFVVFVFSFILSVLIYCSFYPTYRDIFGRPDANT